MHCAHTEFNDLIMFPALFESVAPLALNLCSKLDARSALNSLNEFYENIGEDLSRHFVRGLSANTSMASQRP